MDTVRTRSYKWTEGYFIALVDTADEANASTPTDVDNESLYTAAHSSMNWSKHCEPTRTISFSCSQSSTWRTGDIVTMDSAGRACRQYDSTTCEHTFVVSTQCNSNCLMCPSSEVWRRKGKALPVAVLSEIASRLPQNLSHITITGGEPFLAGRALFSLFDLLKHRFNRTDFLLLTNGRALALKSYADQLSATLPHTTLVGIPLHGANANLHDAITRVPGSFQQTCQGIERLLIRGFPVELRIVVHRYNASVLAQISNMIIEQYPVVRTVKIMGMEMLGNAWVHASELWIPYQDAFESARPAIDRFIEAGIDVAFYNFPLCSVTPEFWTLCRCSISATKVRYLTECKECSVRDACGGVFAGSDRFVEVSPV